CALIDDRKIDVDRIEARGLGFEIIRPALDDFLHVRIRVSAGWNGGVVALDQVLIDPESLIKDAHGRFAAAGDMIQLRETLAFVVEPTAREDHHTIAAP